MVSVKPAERCSVVRIKVGKAMLLSPWKPVPKPQSLLEECSAFAGSRKCTMQVPDPIKALSLIPATVWRQLVSVLNVAA